jgi:hypothetical protein
LKILFNFLFCRHRVAAMSNTLLIGIVCIPFLK